MTRGQEWARARALAAGAVHLAGEGMADLRGDRGAGNAGADVARLGYRRCVNSWRKDGLPVSAPTGRPNPLAHLRPHR